MKLSSSSTVRALYDETADSYAQMMDEEIQHSLYSDTLSQLATAIAELSGPVVDTSCGSGHMLSMYRSRYDPQRAVIGIDLSPRMVDIARARLGDEAQVEVGDMRELTKLPTRHAAAVLSFFALHHLDSGEVIAALSEWYRVLEYGGQLLLAAWEGTGRIDYGDSSDVHAIMHGQAELTGWVRHAGFHVDECILDAVADIGMNAVYLTATKPPEAA